MPCTSTSARRSSLLTAAACLVVACVTWPAAAGTLLDRVIAVVSGTVITLSDARMAIDFGFVSPKGTADPVAQALTWLIEQRLIRDESDRFDAPPPDPAEVEAALVLLRRRFASAAAWDAACRRYALSDDQLRLYLAENLYAEQFAEHRLAAQPVPSEADLERHLRRDPSPFQKAGGPVRLADVRAHVEADFVARRRAEARAEWVARLRRQAEVSELYTPTR